MKRAVRLYEFPAWRWTLLRRDGYSARPANPITAHEETVRRNASAIASPAARGLRVTASQTASGHRKSFTAIATDTAAAARAALSRNRHAIATRSTRIGPMAPYSIAERVKGQTAAIARQRQSRTPSTISDETMHTSRKGPHIATVPS